MATQKIVGKDGKPVPASLIPGGLHSDQKIAYPGEYVVSEINASGTPENPHYLKKGGVPSETLQTLLTGRAQSSNSATGFTSRSPPLKGTSAGSNAYSPHMLAPTPATAQSRPENKQAITQSLGNRIGQQTTPGLQRSKPVSIIRTKDRFKRGVTLPPLISPRRPLAVG